MERCKDYEDFNVRTNSDDLTYSEEENYKKKEANINKNQNYKLSSNIEETSKKTLNSNHSN